tara:strand:+ start:1837 stop:2199 length:363 start_codon:yes stop_codon:yes gene_type:complete
MLFSIIMKTSKAPKKKLFFNNKNRLLVKDLKPNRPVRRLDLIILRIYPRRMIYSEKYTGPVAAACGRDETGLVGIVLWNEQIDNIRIGDIVRLESGWCQMRDGELVVSTGFNGKLRVIDR